MTIQQKITLDRDPDDMLLQVCEVSETTIAVDPVSGVYSVLAQAWRPFEGNKIEVLKPSAFTKLDAKRRRIHTSRPRIARILFRSIKFPIKRDFQRVLFKPA